MPTGSGKTFLSEFAIDHVLTQGLKSVYVTPLRALAEQQAARWKERFPDVEIGVFTGETINASTTRSRYQKSRILIMTPERLDAVFRHWRSHWNWIPDLGLVIIDEVHILGMPQRGPRLEGALTRLIRLNPFVRIIGLSATVPNSSELASWLGGTAYTSAWRHIPLKKKIVRFASAKDKPALLLAEVRRCIDAGGKSLVFCNSRSRVEQLAAFLRANNIPAAPHHAGLVREKRGDTEEAYRSGTLRTLVATSTLEMGLNLPARQVVIYDSFSFTSTGFENLPVWSFMQRAGRAGRPGLDTAGEVVLMLSKWAGDARKYLDEDCEPVQSRLSDSKSLAEQVLVDVFTGLCRTQGELSQGFLPLTLFKHEHPAASLVPTINSLLMSGLLEERQEEEKVKGGKMKEVTRLRVKALGRLAVKLMLAPESVQIIRDALANYTNLKYFDILFLAALSPDSSPVLQANFEELDELYTRIQARPSVLLDQPLQSFRKAIPCLPTTLRILAAIKMATICLAVTEDEPAEKLAETFDIYTADIRMLRESLVRIVQGIAAIATALERKVSDADDDGLPEVARCGSVQDLARQLQDMITYQIPAEMVPLTRLTGVGGKTARKLVDAGYESLSDIVRADPADLVNQKVCGKKLAGKIVEEAYGLIQAFDDTIEYHEEALTVTARKSPSRSASDTKHAAVDLYRFRRALELKVATGDAPCYRVSGGREAHKVLFKGDTSICDCEDFRKRQMPCKHIYAVRLARGEKELVALWSQIKKCPSQAIRDVLPQLWFDMTKDEADR